MARAGAAALMTTWSNIGQQDRSMTVFKYPFHLFERQYLPPETSSGANIMVRVVKRGLSTTELDTLENY